jgi:hypothetical protein
MPLLDSRAAPKVAQFATFVEASDSLRSATDDHREVEITHAAEAGSKLNAFEQHIDGPGVTRTPSIRTMAHLQERVAHTPPGCRYSKVGSLEEAELVADSNRKGSVADSNHRDSVAEL